LAFGDEQGGTFPNVAFNGPQREQQANIRTKKICSTSAWKTDGSSPHVRDQQADHPF
jgi:hypothetical protein